MHPLLTEVPNYPALSVGDFHGKMLSQLLVKPLVIKPCPRNGHWAGLHRCTSSSLSGSSVQGTMTVLVRFFV